MLRRLLLLFALSSLVKGRSIVNTQPSVFSNAAFLPLQPRPNLSPRLSPRGGPNPRNRCRAWEVCKESTFYSTSEAFEPRWLTRVRGGGGNGGDRGGGDMGGDGFGGSGEGDEDGAMSWASVAGVFGSLWNQYSILLQDKPLRTKAITAGIIAILGDLVAQVSHAHIHPYGILNCLTRLHPSIDTQSLEKGWFFTRFSDSEVSKRFDTARSLAVLIDGLVVTGPGLHYLYTFLERLIPSQKGFFAAALHVAVDELIFDPLFVLGASAVTQRCQPAVCEADTSCLCPPAFHHTGFFFLCGALEGRDLVKDIIPQVSLTCRDHYDTCPPLLAHPSPAPPLFVPAGEAGVLVGAEGRLGRVAALPPHRVLDLPLPPRAPPRADCQPDGRDVDGGGVILQPPRRHHPRRATPHSCSVSSQIR